MTTLSPTANSPAAASPNTSAYLHRQGGWLSWILLLVALICGGLAWVVRDTPGWPISLGAALVPLLLTPAFRWLETRDRGDRLQIAFGPLPLFRTSIRYDDLQEVKSITLPWYAGIGIHWVGRGWLWNIAPGRAVQLRTRRSTFYVGTDDLEGLTALLRARQQI